MYVSSRKKHRSMPRCRVKNPRSEHHCRRVKGHSGPHRWHLSGRRDNWEKCGVKSHRSDLCCIVKKGHKGRHRYGIPTPKGFEREEWFSCPPCGDKGFRLLGGSILIEVCDHCKQSRPGLFERNPGGPKAQGGNRGPSRATISIPLGQGKEDFMLVLSRKEGEAIHVGACRVQILEINGNKVRVGIEADPEVLVLRSELVDMPAEIGDLAEV